MKSQKKSFVFVPWERVLQAEILTEIVPICLGTFVETFNYASGQHPQKRFSMQTDNLHEISSDGES